MREGPKVSIPSKQRDSAIHTALRNQCIAETDFAAFGQYLRP
jgi:hypothetical protein